MIVIVLLLAALGVIGLLAAILVVVIRARLREREELARANQPSGPGPQNTAAAAGAPRKPPLAPWLVASGIFVVVVTLVGGMVLRSCHAVGERRARERELANCGALLQNLAQWFHADWDQRKALPPAAEVPTDLWGRCPAGHRYKYVGGGEISLGKEERVLVVETDAHEVPGGFQRWAIVADVKFLASGQTSAEYSSATGGNTSYRYYGMFFNARTLSEAEYETIRQAVEAAPSGGR
jgi:hypothetical protein